MNRRRFLTAIALLPFVGRRLAAAVADSGWTKHIAYNGTEINPPLAFSQFDDISRRFRKDSAVQLNIPMESLVTDYKIIRFGEGDRR